MAAAPVLRKKLVRRVQPDYSQKLRRVFQAAFLALNVWIGVEFYLFVRFYESGGTTPFVERPAGVEGWLPIAGMMNLKAWLETGRVPAIHPATMFLLLAFVAISFVFRKAFCSWLCPVGTLSEYLWRAGRHIFRRNFALPRWADLPLRSLKYILFGLFLWAVVGMSAAAITAFMSGPYGIVADVKMLNFFRHMGVTAAVVIGLIAIASIFVKNFWCRYLCPYGAMLSLPALLSPVRIRRNEERCIDCAKCAKACPSLLPVDRLITIKSAECTACLECVSVCPAEGALHLSRVPAWAVAAGIALIFFGAVGYAKWNGYWRTDLPSTVYEQLVPRAHEFGHP
jgi:polyferredoxin